MPKKRTVIICAACCAIAALLIGGNQFFDAGRGRAYGYQSWIEVTAQRLDDGAFFLTVDSEHETPALGDQAVERTVELINSGQTLDVDVLTGATVSSSAALESAAKALKAAGYDTAALALRPDPNFEKDRLEKCDVVIVGAGGAGLTAAIEAAKNGADVIVVEKLGIAGGSTARSDGLIMATGSALQKYNGVKDTTASFAGFLYGFASESVLQSRLISLAENSGANIDFLRENGVKFSDTLLKTDDNSSEGVERIHQIVTGRGEAAGGALITPLRETAEELGVRFFYGAQVGEIMTDVYSNVVGVRASCLDGSVLTVRAKATIIACGGYDRSPSLIQKYSISGHSPAYSYSGAGNTGEVIELAADLGARIIKGSLIAQLDDFTAGTGGVHGLLVNSMGSRFADESLDAFELGSAVQTSGSSEAWLILDSSAAGLKVKGLAGEGGVVSADTLEALASALGAPNLPATVSRYNYMSTNNLDEDYGKATRWLKEIKSGPYYAVPYKLTSYGSLGGIRTNNRCQAMSNLAVVPGLYAAGEAAFGSYMDEGYPGFGASLAIVVDSGRLAGKNAAIYALTGSNN